MIVRSLLWMLAAICCLAADDQHVMLLSIDGFRHDYAEKFRPPNLIALRDSGASSEALIPAFPSTTFPNHYSMVTGLYPARHGIVDNSFWDPERKEKYFFKDSKFAADGSWYSGVPIWVLAEKHGLRSASMFWPGSEAAIGGVRPSYYFRYDANITNEHRVERVLAWLKLPDSERPRFITLYFDDVDTAGHRYGPDSEQTRQAVARVDAAVGKLVAGIRASGRRVNVLVVSDHGMLTLDRTPVYVGDLADITGFQAATNGPNMMLYASDPALVDRTYTALKRHAADIDVFRRNDAPKRLRFNASGRIGDLVLVARRPVILLAGRRPAKPLQVSAATHGFDPETYPEMRGVFFAAGPAIRKGVRVPAVENVHLYPLIAKLLGLRPPRDIDGRPEALAPVHNSQDAGATASGQ